MRTRDEHKESAIREKAIELIVRDGLDGLSMQKLAKAAGVSPATIYIYYKDRDDLISQVFTQAHEDMFAATLEGFDAEMSFEAGLKVQWKNRMKYLVKNPLYSAFLEQIRHSPYYEKGLSGQAVKFRARMSAFVDNAIRNKELSPLPFEVFWSIAYAPLYQLLKYHTEGRNHKGEYFELTDRIMNQALKLVLKALTP